MDYSNFIIKDDVLVSYIGREEIVIVPEGVKRISSDAFTFRGSSGRPYIFYEWITPKMIVLPTTLEIIDEKAFEYLDHLITINIPPKVSKIPDRCFYRCESLARVIMQGSEDIDIEDSAFKYCENLNQIVLIKRKPVHIGNEAFSGIDDLYIYIDSRILLTIGENIFSDANVKVLTCLDNIKISDKWFIGNVRTDSLSNILPRKSVSNINRESFPQILPIILSIYDELDEKCKNEWLPFIKQWAIYYIYMEEYIDFKLVNTILDNVELNLDEVDVLLEKSSIKQNNIEMTSKILDYKNTHFTQEEISEHSFNKLGDIGKVGKGLFGYYIKDDNTVCIIFYKGNEEDIVVPSCINNLKVSEIADDVFNVESSLYSNKEDSWNLERIKSITIEEGIEKIGTRVFSNLAKINQINLPNSVCEIGEESFSHIYGNIKKLVLPANIKKIPRGAFMGSQIDVVKIPEGVEVIESEAFSKSKVKCAILPNSVREIKRDAFKECTELKVVHLPEIIEKIEPYTFYYCCDLSSINLPESIKEIGGYAFFKTNIKEIKLPSHLEYIGYKAFYSNHLASLYIPPSVENIKSEIVISNSVIKSEEGSVARLYAENTQKCVENKNRAFDEKYYNLLKQAYK